MPVGAVFLGMAILGEQIHAGDFCGMVLIGLGLTAIDGRPLAWFKLRSQSAIFERRREASS